MVRERLINPASTVLTVVMCANYYGESEWYASLPMVADQDVDPHASAIPNSNPVQVRIAASGGQ